MKPIHKVRNALRNARWRVMGKIEYAKVGQNLGAAYLHAYPKTQAGRAGHQALAEVTTKVLQALGPEHVFSCDTEDAETWRAPRPVERIAGLLETAKPGASYALRMQQGDGLKLVQSLGERLRACVMAYLPVCDRKQDGQPQIVQMTDLLMKHGFEPVLRDAEKGDEWFHILFLRKDVLASACLGPLSGWVQKAVDATDAPHIKPCQIPVLIPCFNNQTYCRTMIEQLHARGLDDITLLDNASTSPAMHAFLDQAEQQVKVRRLGENLGPKQCFVTPEVFDDLPRYFCVTDPDIVFNRFLPHDFMGQLIDLTKEYKIGKVGFALDISHRQFFRDLSVKLLFKEWKTWEWEERFWAKPVGVTRSNDTIFMASVDTTFALYDKERWAPQNFIHALRVAGRFTATHAPWFQESTVPSEEQAMYRQDGLYSYYKM